MECLLEYIRISPKFVRERQAKNALCTDVCGIEQFKTYKQGGNQWPDVPVIRQT